MSNTVTTLDKIDAIARVILGGERIEPVFEGNVEYMFPEFSYRHDTPRMSFDHDDIACFGSPANEFWVSGLVLGWYAWMAKEHRVKMFAMIADRRDNKWEVTLRSYSNPHDESDLVSRRISTIDGHAPSLHMALFEAMYLWAKQKETNNLTNHTDDTRTDRTDD